jgi:hypothetical protein
MVGVCTVVPAMTDPDLECRGGYCDGMGACDVPDGGMLLDAAIVPDAGMADAAVSLPDAAIGLDAAPPDAAVPPPAPASSCAASAPVRDRAPWALALALIGVALGLGRRTCSRR